MASRRSWSRTESVLSKRWARLFFGGGGINWVGLKPLRLVARTQSYAQGTIAIPKSPRLPNATEANK